MVRAARDASCPAVFSIPSHRLIADAHLQQNDLAVYETRIVAATMADPEEIETGGQAALPYPLAGGGRSSCRYDHPET